MSTSQVVPIPRKVPLHLTLSIRLKRWLSLWGYGLFTRTLFRAATAPHTLRARFERFGHVSRESLQRKYPSLRFEDHRLGALHVEALRTQERARCVVLHLHGGGFLFGSPNSYRNRAMRLSYRFGAEVFVPDYRLAPEHRYPAALDDALLAFQYVQALRPKQPIIVTGDSAGGGLALSMLCRLRALGQRMPTAAVLLSPWTDLSASGASLLENRGLDRWLSRAHLERWATHYLGDTNPCDPLASPVFADLSGLPPLLILTGEHEVLRDDATRVVERALRHGTRATLLVGKGMQHDWPLTLPWLEESRGAWRAMEAFVKEVTGS